EGAGSGAPALQALSEPMTRDAMERATTLRRIALMAPFYSCAVSQNNACPPMTSTDLKYSGLIQCLQAVGVDNQFDLGVGHNPVAFWKVRETHRLIQAAGSFPATAGGQGDCVDSGKKPGSFDGGLHHEPSDTAALRCRIYTEHADFQLVRSGDVRILAACTDQGHGTDDLAGPAHHIDFCLGCTLCHLAHELQVLVIRAVEMTGSKIGFCGQLPHALVVLGSRQLDRQIASAE